MNEQNLIPNEARTPEERSANAKKAGIASGEARRNRKTIQKILVEIVDAQIKDTPSFKKIAEKLGIEDKKSIKEIYTLICLLNSAKRGKLEDLEQLMKLLGEQTRGTEEDEERQITAHNELIQAIKESHENNIIE